MNFGELIAKGGALFARKGADALADTLETAPPADLARIQASVSGGILPRSSGCIGSDIGILSQTSGAWKGNTMWQQTMMLPTGVDAVSVAVYSDVADVSTYTGIKVSVQTTTSANLSNPVDGAAFTPVTFGGAANPTFVAGSVADPVPIWSDTVPVVNRGIGINYLIVRVYYPAGVANGGGMFDANNDGTGSRAAKLSALGAGSLYGYTPPDNTTNTTAPIVITRYALPISVKSNFRKRVPVVWQFGDSTRQGWYGAGSVAAVERWGISKTLAGNPVSVSNNGYSGQTSAQYLARLKRMVAAGQRCDVLVYQIASPNDGFSSAISSAQIAQAHEAIQIAASMKAAIILDGPFPMTQNTPSAAQISVVTNADSFGKAMIGRDVYYADYASLHQPAAFGQWVSSYNYNNDGLHPNEAGVAGPILAAQSVALSAATGI